MLTDTALKNLKGKEKIYKVTDRDGMYAVVKPTGTIEAGAAEERRMRDVMISLHDVAQPHDRDEEPAR